MLVEAALPALGCQVSSCSPAPCYLPQIRLLFQRWLLAILAPALTMASTARFVVVVIVNHCFGQVATFISDVTFSFVFPLFSLLDWPAEKC